MIAITALSTLKARPLFTRSLVLIWLLTWTAADPLYLLQELFKTNGPPAEATLSSAHPGGLQLTRHHLDVLTGSCTEGTSNHNNSTSSDDLATEGAVDLWGTNIPRPFVLWIAKASCSSHSLLASPRAPPSIFA